MDNGQSYNAHFKNAAKDIYSYEFAKIIPHESRAYSGSTIVGRVDFTVQVITNVHKKM